MFWSLVFNCVIGGALLLLLLCRLGRRLVRWRHSLARHWRRSAPEVVSREVIRRIDRLNRADEQELVQVISEHMRSIVHSTSLIYDILPPQPIEAGELDRQIDTDKPVKIVDKEPKPHQHRGPRYRVMIDRIISPRYVKDVDELRTYDDIRAIFGVPAKGMVEELDGKFIAVINQLLQAPGKELPETGLVQWQTMEGEITPQLISKALCALPDSLAVVLTNKHFVRGLSFNIALGKKIRWVLTDNRQLVPDGTMFLFTYPEQLGRAFVLEDVRLCIDRRAYEVNFFSHMSMGATIASVSGVARVDFTQPKAKKKSGRK